MARQSHITHASRHSDRVKTCRKRHGVFACDAQGRAKVRDGETIRGRRPQRFEYRFERGQGVDVEHHTVMFHKHPEPDESRNDRTIDIGKVGWRDPTVRNGVDDRVGLHRILTPHRHPRHDVHAWHLGEQRAFPLGERRHIYWPRFESTVEI